MPLICQNFCTILGRPDSATKIESRNLLIEADEQSFISSLQAINLMKEYIKPLGYFWIEKNNSNI